MNESKLSHTPSKDGIFEKDADGQITQSTYPCQVCKNHANKPSRCLKYGMYVGRKNYHTCIELDQKKENRYGLGSD